MRPLSGVPGKGRPFFLVMHSLLPIYAQNEALVRWEVIYMDAKKYVLRLLEDLEHVTSSEEREAFDSSWLRGYVAGVSIAAQIALELERGEGA